jgi:pimeloyl-ACP methyl ester carboxylesterase
MPVTVQQAKIHLVDQGTGTPTLFLHGVADSSDVWSGVISRLKHHYRCLAPDLPAFGRSTAPENFDCSLQNMADFVDGLVDAIGIKEPLNLVVHDFGGPFGLAWAVKHPARIKHLAIMNTPFFSDYRWHFWAKVWRTPFLGELSWQLMSRWVFTQEMKRGSRKLTVGQIQEIFALITPAMQRMILRLYRTTDPENFRGWEDELLKVTARVPTRVLWGGHDPYIPRKFAERYGAQSVHYFPDSGHWVQLEEAEQVSKNLLEFFAT